MCVCRLLPYLKCSSSDVMTRKKWIDARKRTNECVTDTTKADKMQKRTNVVPGVDVQKTFNQPRVVANVQPTRCTRQTRRPRQHLAAKKVVVVMRNHPAAWKVVL